MLTIQKKKHYRKSFSLLSVCIISIVVLVSSCLRSTPPGSSELSKPTYSSSFIEISSNSNNSFDSSTISTISQGGNEYKPNSKVPSGSVSSSIIKGSYSKTSTSKAMLTPTQSPKFNKADLPIVIYKDSDDPLQVITELIDRTNKCPMKSLTLRNGHMENDYYGNYKSYGTTIGVNIGVDPKERLIKNHQYAEIYRDQTKTELYRGIELEGKYFTSLDPDKVFHSVTKSEYKKIYDFYDSNALIDFNLPLQNEIEDVEFHNYKSTVSEYAIIIKITLNKNYFNRKFDYYKSRILQLEQTNITFTDGKITIYANENGILQTFVQRINYTYKGKLWLTNATEYIEFECNESANYRLFNDEFRTEILDFVKTVK